VTSARTPGAALAGTGGVRFARERTSFVPEHIGFVGLGVMGKPMAKHLIAAGHHLTVHNRSRGAVDELVSAGAAAAASPAEVARASRVVITMLPDTSDVETVLTGPDGVLSGVQGGATVIDMSSISPVATERLAEVVAKHGASMLDAPVSGGEIGAINAQLSIMVGGDEGAFQRVRPILEKMGNPEKIVYIGRSGAGQICKVCNQVAIGGALAGVSEAFALARKAGVDAARVRQALLGGFAASRVLEVHGERMLVDNYKPGFRARLYQKDMRLANETAAANGVSMPANAVVAQLLNALIASGGADLDYAALGTVLFSLAGCKTIKN
jgi:2-hydroxy-3-oxopropionate reductase